MAENGDLEEYFDLGAFTTSSDVQPLVTSAELYQGVGASSGACPSHQGEDK
jgi:hypothetical protein